MYSQLFASINFKINPDELTNVSGTVKFISGGIVVVIVVAVTQNNWYMSQK